MRLDIRKATVAETLIELGLRMGVSVGGVEACNGPARPLIGTFGLREALDRALDSTSCAYSFVDPRTVRFSPRPPTASPQLRSSVATRSGATVLRSAAALRKEFCPSCAVGVAGGGASPRLVRSGMGCTPGVAWDGVAAAVRVSVLANSRAVRDASSS